MKANKEQRIPTISVIGGVGQGKSSIIEALWNTSIKVESSGNSIYKVNDNIPGRGIMTFNVKELPPVIYSLQKEWLKNESNLNELALSDVILYIVPASSFGYKQEVAFLRNLLQLDCYHNQHIVICLSKADYLLIDEESKGIGIDSITRLMQINDTCNRIDDILNYKSSSNNTLVHMLRDNSERCKCAFYRWEMNPDQIADYYADVVADRCNLFAHADDDDTSFWRTVASGYASIAISLLENLTEDGRNNIKEDVFRHICGYVSSLFDKSLEKVFSIVNDCYKI